MLIPQTPVPGMAVRENTSKHGKIAKKENKKHVVVVEPDNEKKKSKLRSINSEKLVTYRHQIYSQKGLGCRQWLSSFLFVLFITDCKSRPCRATTRGTYSRDQSGPELPFTHKYSVGQVLGQGGFGVVYGGIRMEDGAPVAVKHVPRCKIEDWTEVGLVHSTKIIIFLYR